MEPTISEVPEDPKAKVSIDHRGNAKVKYLIAGRLYDWKTEPRCHVCKSSDRSEIEGLILEGYGYGMVIDEVGDEGLDTQNLRRHVENGHMPIQETVRRVLMDKLARERGLDIDNFEGLIGDHITFAQLGIQRLLQKMGQGKIDPSIDDGIKMANLLVKAEKVAGDGLTQEAHFEFVVRLREALMQFCSPEQRSQIVAYLDRAQSNALEATEIIDVEEADEVPV